MSKKKGVLRPIIDAISCPTCKAKKGSYCLNSSGVPFYSSVHKGRVTKAVEAGINISKIPGNIAPRGKAKKMSVSTAKSKQVKALKAAIKKVKEEAPKLKAESNIKWIINDELVDAADVTVSGTFGYTQHWWSGDCVTKRDERSCYELLRDEFITCLKDCGDDLEKLKEYLTIDEVTLNYYHGES